MTHVIYTDRDNVSSSEYYPVMFSDGRIEIRVKSKDDTNVKKPFLDLYIDFGISITPSFIVAKRQRFYHKWLGITLEDITRRRWEKAKEWCHKRNVKNKTDTKNFTEIVKFLR